MDTTALSVETRVLVLRLLNMTAMVLPESEPLRCAGGLPDLKAALYTAAFWTSFVNSAVVRSPMERKWRGAKGEVRGVDGVAWLEEDMHRDRMREDIRRHGRSVLYEA